MSHRIREAVAGKIIDFAYISSQNNFADILTKPLSIQAHHHLTKPWLFRRAEVIEEATKSDIRRVNMVRIPSDEEQDDTERQLRMREYMELFREEMDMIKRQGKRKELI